MAKTITEGALKGVKTRAKKLKRATGITHTAALETIAREEGFQSYAHMLRHVERKEATS